MRQMFGVLLLPAPNTQSHPSPCTLRAPQSPAAFRLPARSSPRTACPFIPRMPSSRLGRTQTPCPTPTSGSSVARGRAPPPSSPLAMTRTPGLREAAPLPEALAHEL